MPRPILIFDFDGTVALGDGPVRAYARAVAEEAGLDDSFVPSVIAGLAADEGTDAGATPLDEDHAIDAYDLVRVQATAAGASAEALARGYARSRAELASEAAPITAPEGLATFLESVDAERILLTNAPQTRLPEALVALGLDRHFDRVIAEAGKPAGLTALLDTLGAEADVLAIGDIWRNDLAPAHERGHATALVGGYPDPAATPEFRARTLPELLPALSDWVHARALTR